MPHRCTLIGRTLFYSKGSGQTPIGSIRLRGVASAIVASSQADSDSDSEDTVLGPPRHYGLTISTKLRGTHHFLATSAEERDKWVFFMQMASGTLPSNVGTATERLLRKVSSKSNMSEVVAKEELLQASDDLSPPLTTLLSAKLEEEAVEIWKSVKLYTSVEIESGAYEYHVLLAQGLVEKCLGTPELQNELYCQLIRQTNSKDPESVLCIQCWQLLTLCIPIFLPVAFFLRYLELHLKRRAKDKKTTKSGKLAAYALTCLERHVAKGGRRCPPSRAEIISVVLRDPYEYGHPLSCPVQLANGSEFLAGFDFSTTFLELAEHVSGSLGMRNVKATGFSIFTSLMADPDAIISRKPGVKVCDALFEWEKAMKEATVGLLDGSLVPMFHFQRRLYFSATDTIDGASASGGGGGGGGGGAEDVLNVYQIADYVNNGSFHVSLEDSIKMGAILAQIENGDLDAQETIVGGIITYVAKFVPAALRILSLDAEQDEDAPPRLSAKEIDRKFAEEWRSVAGVHETKLAKEYLTTAKKWSLYGAMVRRGEVVGTGKYVWMAAHEIGIEILDEDSLDLIDSVAYKDIRNFGGPGGHFRLLYHKDEADSRSELLLKFAEGSAHQEMTYAVASYINEIVRQEGITCEAAKINEDVEDHETSLMSVEA